PRLWRIYFTCPLEHVDILAGALEPFSLAISTYETNDEHIWMVEATAKDQPEIQEVQASVSVAATLLGVDIPQIHVEPLPETDWLEATWKNFPPREIGPFYVYGSHNKSAIPEHLIGLEINAATAFGSGEHETTTGCLLALAQLKKTRKFNNPLDMGCGSGILAMATTKLWQVPVTAVDNDPESIRVTIENARMNYCEHLLTPLVSEGFASPDVTIRGPFDLIIANILAVPLCLMAQDMINNTQNGGNIILSGLLIRQERDVIEAYQAVGAKFLEHIHINDWATLMFEK
ncbi:MAG TPA: 50S ribosomal protein L11 methyltransferase, partial [Candidatus Nitrosotenuis sp.]|nr:50S ribosomal protein L11 methyltransferase [Candidatus Nitrosotenuis sp.]